MSPGMLDTLYHGMWIVHVGILGKRQPGRESDQLQNWVKGLARRFSNQEPEETLEDGLELQGSGAVYDTTTHDPFGLGLDDWQKENRQDANERKALENLLRLSSDVVRSYRKTAGRSAQAVIADQIFQEALTTGYLGAEDIGQQAIVFCFKLQANPLAEKYLDVFGIIERMANEMSKTLTITDIKGPLEDLYDNIRARQASAREADRLIKSGSEVEKLQAKKDLPALREEIDYCTFLLGIASTLDIRVSSIFGDPAVCCDARAELENKLAEKMDEAVLLHGFNIGDGRGF